MNFFKKYFLRRKVRKFLDSAQTLLAFERDIWSRERVRAVESFIAEGRKILKRGKTEEMHSFAAEMETTFAGLIIFKPRFASTMREWLDVFAVVMAVAFGIRGLFLQPFLIPTGSMQPTLFGIHYVNAETPYFNANPKYGEFFNELLYSAARVYVKSENGGKYTPFSLRRAGKNSVFEIGGVAYSLPGDPAKVAEYANLSNLRFFQPDAVVANGFSVGGDSLFVERISHLFFGLERGDIVVFNTSGILGPGGKKLSDMSGFYYIKRLVGLPGDTLKISGGILYVMAEGTSEFRPITDFSNKFDKIFSGLGGYHGYTNGRMLSHLSNENDTFTVPENSYFMLGDNSGASLDSRYWGVVPRENIVGKALVVIWPFSRRWGSMDVPPIPIKSDATPSPMTMQ